MIFGLRLAINACTCSEAAGEWWRTGKMATAGAVSTTLDIATRLVQLLPLLAGAALYHCFQVFAQGFHVVGIFFGYGADLSATNFCCSDLAAAKVRRENRTVKENGDGFCGAEYGAGSFDLDFAINRAPAPQ